MSDPDTSSSVHLELTHSHSVHPPLSDLVPLPHLEDPESDLGSESDENRDDQGTISDRDSLPSTKVAENLSVLPSEYLKSYRFLIKRMAATLQLNVSQLTPEVTSTVQKDNSTVIALPIPGVLLQHAKEPWLKPASVPVSSII